MSEQSPDVHQFSNQLADAVQTAGAWIVRVHARRGLPASGIVLGLDLVVAADHTIDPQREDEIRVGLPDGRELAASVAGRDPATDVAVLRLAEASGVQAPTVGGSPARVGSLGLVVARPRQQPAASLAFISGVGGPARTRRGGILERYIQVDTVMYPGFSGGALTDTSGAILGLATSGVAFDGPSIALPWDSVSELATYLAQHGRVRRGYLGVGSQPVSLSTAARELAGGQELGLLVVHLEENGPAARGGFLQGDILIALDDARIESADDLQAILGPARVGKDISATVVRGGARADLSVTVGERT